MRILLLLLLAAAARSEDRRKTVGDKPPAWAKAVAKLTWKTKRGRFGQGTAVLVAPRLAMTAHHCVKDWDKTGTLRFGFHGLKRTQLETRTATVLQGSVAGDWAILLLDKPVTTIPPLKMAAKRLKDCDKRMRLAGYSADRGAGKGGLVLTYDDQAKLKKVRTPEGRLLTDAIALYGASGGPAFAKDKESDRWHWFGLVQGNINPHARSRVTYVVYQVCYEKALRKAIRKLESPRAPTPPPR